MRRKLAIAAATAFTAAGLATAIAPAANAAARDGVCQSGEFCYYWFTDQEESLSDFTGSVSNYGSTQPTCYDFKGPGLGKGECIKNNAESVWNRSSKTVKVYFNSGFGDPHQTIAPGEKANLNSSLINNNASHQFS